MINAMKTSHLFFCGIALATLAACSSDKAEAPKLPTTAAPAPVAAPSVASAVQSAAKAPVQTAAKKQTATAKSAAKKAVKKVTPKPAAPTKETIRQTEEVISTQTIVS